MSVRGGGAGNRGIHLSRRPRRSRPQSPAGACLQASGPAGVHWQLTRTHMVDLPAARRVTGLDRLVSSVGKPLLAQAISRSQTERPLDGGSPRRIFPHRSRVPVRRALLSGVGQDRADGVRGSAFQGGRGTGLDRRHGEGRSSRAGIAVRDVSRVDRLSGDRGRARRKTLHPSVHGALLGVRDDPEAQPRRRSARHRADRLVVVILIRSRRSGGRGGPRASVVEVNIDIWRAGHGTGLGARTTPMSPSSPPTPLEGLTPHGVLDRAGDEFSAARLSLEFRQKLAAKALAIRN